MTLRASKASVINSIFPCSGFLLVPFEADYRVMRLTRERGKTSHLLILLIKFERLVSYLTEQASKGRGFFKYLLNTIFFDRLFHSMQQLRVRIEGRHNVQLVRGKDAAPDVRGTQRQPGHIHQPRAINPMEIGLILGTKISCQRCRYQLRQMRRERYRGIVFTRAHLNCLGSNLNEELPEPCRDC